MGVQSTLDLALEEMEQRMSKVEREEAEKTEEDQS
jgi:hypothetical protein